MSVASMTEKEKIRMWAEAWKSATPALERLRHADIRAFDLERDWTRAVSLFEIGVQFGSLEDTSGLVRQQESFALYHRRKSTDNP